MRIVAGRFRGKTLAAPEGRDAVRPTSDRTREAVFNVLMHRFQGSRFSLIGARVIDVFAGTGAMGLEALSRGAAHVTFLDKGHAALAALRFNIQTLGVKDEVEIVAADAAKPPRAKAPALVAFLDPPYGEDLIVPTLTALAAQGWLAPGALCVCETAFNTDIEPPPGFTAEDSRRYGKAKVTFLQYEG